MENAECGLEKCRETNNRCEAYSVLGKRCVGASTVANPLPLIWQCEGSTSEAFASVLWLQQGFKTARSPKHDDFFVSEGEGCVILDAH